MINKNKDDYIMSIAIAAIFIIQSQHYFTIFNILRKILMIPDHHEKFMKVSGVMLPFNFTVSNLCKSTYKSPGKFPFFF